MASIDTLVARDMADIVATSTAPLSRQVIIWDSSTTTTALDAEDAIATVYANVFYKLEDRKVDERGKVQCMTATLNFLNDDGEGEAIDVDEAGWFQIEGKTFKIRSANLSGGNWVVRGEQQRRTERSAGQRTHGR